MNDNLISFYIKKGLALINTESESALVRWCVFFIAVILYWFLVVEPLAAFKEDLSEKFDSNLKLSARLESLQGQERVWQEAEKEAAAAVEVKMAELFLQSTDTAAQSVIQGLLESVCKDLNISVESKRLVDPEKIDGVGTKLGVAMTVSGRLIDILTLLDKVSQANHVFQIDQWLIRQDKNGVVISQFVIAGFRGGVG